MAWQQLLETETSMGSPPTLTMLGAVEWPLAGGLALVALVVGIGLGTVLIRMLGGRSIAEAKLEAERVVEAAKAEGQTRAQQLVLDADKAVLERKARADKELEGARVELREGERRLAKREDLLVRKEEGVGQRETTLA